MPVDKEAATDRLMRFLAVEGVTGKEERIGRELRAALKESGVPDNAIRLDDANARIPVPTETGNLIVDLRFDTGGDIDLTRDWQRALAARVPGQIYVLVSRHTFSAGIVSAAAFKHDAPTRVHVVGEAVGDRLRWWSEGDNVCMPNSHYCLHMTTGLWDLVHGCAAQPGCYGDQYGAQVSHLDPDIDAPITAGSWLAGRDPGMEAIARSKKPPAAQTPNLE